ncbi:hypothetical protein K3217_16520 [bacterium BD-1]|nr:hypothetical protein [Ottowia caeni]
MAIRKKAAPRPRAAATDPFTKAVEARRKSSARRTPRVTDRVVLSWAKAQLGKELGRQTPRNASLPNIAPVVELTPRAPHGAHGHMDLLSPGRWDCESNLVFMRPIVHGNSPGDWDGSVAYVRLKAPADGSYLVAAVFAGFSSAQGGQGLVLKMSGPWGSNTASGQTTEPNGPVAIWNAQAGDSLYFSVTCSGGTIGYLQAIRLYPLG